LETNSLKDKKDRDDTSYAAGLWSANSEGESETEEHEDEPFSEVSHSDHDDASIAPSDGGDDGYSDEDEANGLEGRGSDVTLKLREILFYDDKISIFKVRHCRL